MIPRPRLIAMIATLALAAAPATAGSACCPADADDSGTVAFGDILVILGEFGRCVEGCAGDVNGDDVVDFQDLLVVLAAWGPCRFDFGEPRDDPEAEQITLEMLGADGPLLAPDDIFDRVDRDLDLIREAEPALADQMHAPAWRPDHLIVKKLPDEPQDDYDLLNVCFQIVEERHLFGDWFLLTFPGNLNAPALAETYAALGSIDFAEPDGIIGGQNFWRPLVLAKGRWRWSIDDGFCDCFDGCDCHRFYVFDVLADGTVTLVSFEERMSQCCAF